MNNTELATRPASDLAADFMPVLAIGQAVERRSVMVEYVKQIMVPGRDYGVIPGTEKNKGTNGEPSSKDNVLLKPGAEKLCTLFGLSPHFEDYRVVEDWDRGIYYYAFRCTLSRNGRVLGECIGSANSREKKYRRETRTCPECNKAAIKKGFPKRGEKTWTWYCDRKSGGCGRNFQSDDPAIVEQSAGIDVNAAADSINTLQKMAQKRAFVGAALVATNASEFFTQDVEDAAPAAATGDVVDGEVIEPTADVVADFMAAWNEWSVYHQVNQAAGEAILKWMLEKRSIKSLDGASDAERAALIEVYGKYTRDQIDGVTKAIAAKAGTGPKAAGAEKPPATTTASEQPITAALVPTWEALENEACKSAEGRGVTPDKVIAGFMAWLGSKNPAATTEAERMNLLSAVRTGNLNYETGVIGKGAKPAAKAA